ncbi:hypothetical protein TNCV_4536681 [Trichonephila clavipes]|nr:hypothetical protein TNCV_4536681 [Trichonephila clavipes]
MATDLTAVKGFILNLVWQFIKQGVDSSNGHKNEIAIVPDFHKRILFSDDALLVEWLCQQTKLPHLEEANPQVYVETPLHPEKTDCLRALWAGGIIGPYFFKTMKATTLQSMVIGIEP